MKLKIILAWFLLAVLGATAWGKRDGPGAPRLFSLPNRSYAPTGKMSVDKLHRIQYQEAKEQILRLYYEHEVLSRIPADPREVLDTEEKRDLEIHKLVGSLNDRWTVYRSPAQLDNVNEHLRLGDVHLGLTLDRSGQDFIVAYVSGRSPAYKAGLQRGDQITHIGETALKGLTKDEVEELLYAQPGELKVTYKVNDVASDALLNVQPDTTANITARAVGDYWYFHCQHFGNDRLLSEFASAAAGLNRSIQTPEGIILDLRGNQGGLMDVAYQFVSVFIKEGKVGEHVMRSGRLISRTSLEAKPFLPTLLDPTVDNLRLLATLQTAPLVVLVDGSTISAGEMVTSALQGSERATIMGTTTWGKGVSFHTLRLSSGGQLQICTGTFFGPTGLDHRNSGIKPDVMVEVARRARGDPKLDAAIEHLKSLNRSAQTQQLVWTYVRIGTAIALLGALLVPLTVLIVSQRKQSLAHRKARRQWQDQQVARWLSQLPREETLDQRETVLTAEHFMVGARCHHCDHKFTAGETVIELVTSQGEYMCCQSCQPSTVST